MKMVDGDNAGERGVVVAMVHGLCVSFCVCGEAMKIEAGPQTSHNCVIHLIVLVLLRKENSKAVNVETVDNIPSLV